MSNTDEADRMRNYQVKSPPFGRSGAPYCVVAYEDAISLATFLASKSVVIGLSMTPGSSAMISFPQNSGTVQIWQAIVDEWDRQQGKCQ